jgi:hypothetical protein
MQAEVESRKTRTRNIEFDSSFSLTPNFSWVCG